MAETIEGICNKALVLVGYTRPIGNLYEGSKAAMMALQVWAQTRDALLDKQRPVWATRDINLVLLKSAPNIVNGSADYSILTWDPVTYPELPWLYEYQYPTDCIQPLIIKTQPILLPHWRPRDNPFRLNFDNGTQRTILTNVENAILSYIMRVTDPNDWQTDFIEMMVLAMVEHFKSLAPQPQPQQRRQPQEDQNASNTAG